MAAMLCAGKQTCAALQPKMGSMHRHGEPTEHKHLTLWLAGDVMTGRGIDQVMAHPCSPELYEGWVRDAREYVKLAEKVHGRMNPSHVHALKAAHLDVCSLANNHVLDWGIDGLRETLSALQAAGLHTAGAGQNRKAAEAPAMWRSPQGGRWLVFAWASADSGVPHSWQAMAQQPGIRPCSTPTALRSKHSSKLRPMPNGHWSGILRYPKRRACDDADH